MLPDRNISGLSSSQDLTQQLEFPTPEQRTRNWLRCRLAKSISSMFLLHEIKAFRPGCRTCTNFITFKMQFSSIRWQFLRINGDGSSEIYEQIKVRDQGFKSDKDPFFKAPISFSFSVRTSKLYPLILQTGGRLEST